MNRRQITGSDFERQESGAYTLKEASRKIVLTAWQERKQEEITHPFLDEKTTGRPAAAFAGALLARHLRVTSTLIPRSWPAERFRPDSLIPILPCMS